MSFLHPMIDTLKLLPIGGPGVCNIAVTNACNAKCDFCNYAADKPYVQGKKWVDEAEFRRAVAILHARGIRYVTLVGGEPLLHPDLLKIITHAARCGIRPSLVTNGSRLSPHLVEKLEKAGLKTLFISIDAPSSRLHEANRGLPGVCRRIEKANRACAHRRMKTVASVTINKLIDDFPALIRFLSRLGFGTVNFAYPKTVLHSRALSFSHDSKLIDFTPDELALKLETIRSLKDTFPILNSREALTEILRFVRKEAQHYPCFGGYKYFYLDFHLDVYRCDFWSEPMCSIHDFLDRDFVRDPCTQCISGCYRDASVLMHAGVSLGDAIDAIRNNNPSEAAGCLAKPTNFRSIKTLVQDWTTIRKLAQKPEFGGNRHSV